MSPEPVMQRHLSPVELMQLRCLMYAKRVVKPGTHFFSLAPADHRRRANGGGPDGEASGPPPQPSSLSDAAPAPARAPSSPSPGSVESGRGRDDA